MEAPTIGAGYAAVWFLLFAVLGALALPSASALFPRFPDRGAGLAIPLALAFLGFVGFWAGRVSVTGATVVALTVLALASAIALRRGVVLEWRRYGETLLVFAAAFAGLIAVRSGDPSVVPIGGEKFLDYALLNGLSRAETLPPEDPWFAGERIRYYYGGHLVVALLGRLARTPPHYAYNLGLAGVYATVVSATYGLAGSIAADRTNRGVGRARAGLFAALFVGFASNLVTPVRLLAWLIPGGRSIADALGVPLTRRGRETVAFGLEAFDYWDASRVIPGTINEFPFFGFFNGDLHAHLLSMPFSILLVGVCYGYWLTPAEELRRRRLLAFGAVPVLAGWLAAVNTWDLPIALGLAWLALALAPAPPWTLLPAPIRRPVEDAAAADGPAVAEIARPIAGAAIVGVVALLAALSALPFFAGAASTGGRTVALVVDRSTPAELLLVHGAFLAVAAWFLSTRLDAGDRRFATATLTALALVTVLLDAAALLLIAPLVIVGWYAVRAGRGGYETLLFVAGAGAVVTVELVYLSEGAGPGRLNTVFKTYAHVWVLWSIAAGVALGSLTSASADRRASDRSAVDGGSDRPIEDRDAPRHDRDALRENRIAPSSGTGTERTSGVASVLALALVCSASVYGVLALADHADERVGPTLDARHEVRATAPDEAAAFAWLAERDGQPRIVEAPTPSEHAYGTADSNGTPPPSRYVSGASTFSGLPTIVGWPHAADYHGEDVYRERVADAETVFEGSEAERATVLREYDVDYVYVGPNERAWYDPDLASDDGVTVAERFGGVTIYRVDRADLTDGPVTNRATVDSPAERVR